MNSILLTIIMASSSYSSVRDQWLPVVKAASEHYGLDWKLLDSLIYEESGWNPNAVSHKGAVGLTQLMPPTAKELLVNDSYDPGQNIWGGAWYLKKMNDRFCNWALALAAYNAGPNRVEKCDCIPEISVTQIYVRKIIGRWGDIESASLSVCE